MLPKLSNNQDVTPETYHVSPVVTETMDLEPVQVFHRERTVELVQKDSGAWAWDPGDGFPYIAIDRVSEIECAMLATWLAFLIEAEACPRLTREGCRFCVSIEINRMNEMTATIRAKCLVEALASAVQMVKAMSPKRTDATLRGE